MSYVVELSEIALKRLKSEANDWAKGGDNITSGGTISATPLEGSLSSWCANISIPFTEIVFHLHIEIPPVYPFALPSISFKNKVTFPTTDMYLLADGRLDSYGLLPRDPSWTIAKYLNFLQEKLSKMFKPGQVPAINARKYTETFHCHLCSHGGSHSSKYYPPLQCLEMKSVSTIPAINTPFTVPTNPLENLQCFVTRSTPITDPTEIFGYGVVVDITGALYTTAAVLVHSVFTTATTGNYFNFNFQFFIPLFLSQEHWLASGAFTLFKEMTSKIFSKMYQVNQGLYPPPPMQAALVVAAIMNSIPLSIASSNSNLEQQILGYYHLLQLLKGLANSFPEVREGIDEKIKAFIEYPSFRWNHPVRCPNLGRFLQLLHISRTYSWSDIATVFLEEYEIRQVAQYYTMARSDLAPITRNKLVFENYSFTEASRRNMCFMIKFFQFSRSAAFQLVDGTVPENVLRSINSLRDRVMMQKNWTDYHRLLDLPMVSEEEKHILLLGFMEQSAARGYHQPPESVAGRGGGRGGGRGAGAGRGRGGGRGYHG